MVKRTELERPGDSRNPRQLDLLGQAESTKLAQATKVGWWVGPLLTMLWQEGGAWADGLTVPELQERLGGPGRQPIEAALGTLKRRGLVQRNTLQRRHTDGRLYPLWRATDKSRLAIRRSDERIHHE